MKMSFGHKIPCKAINMDIYPDYCLQMSANLGCSCDFKKAIKTKKCKVCGQKFPDSKQTLCKECRWKDIQNRYDA